MLTLHRSTHCAKRIPLLQPQLQNWNTRRKKVKVCNLDISLRSSVSSTAKVLQLNGCPFATCPNVCGAVRPIHTTYQHYPDTEDTWSNVLSYVCGVFAFTFYFEKPRKTIGVVKWQVSRTDILWLALLPTTIASGHYYRYFVGCIEYHFSFFSFFSFSFLEWASGALSAYRLHHSTCWGFDHSLNFTITVFLELFTSKIIVYDFVNLEFDWKRVAVVLVVGYKTRIRIFSRFLYNSVRVIVFLVSAFSLSARLGMFPLSWTCDQTVFSITINCNAGHHNAFWWQLHSSYQQGLIPQIPGLHATKHFSVRRLSSDLLNWW